MNEQTSKVKEQYEGGLCPDCNSSIPDNAVPEGECSNCGHVWAVQTDEYAHLTVDQKSKLISIAIEVEMAGDGETTFSAKEAAAHVDGLTVYEMLERMGYFEVGTMGVRGDELRRRFGFDPETGEAYPK